MASGTHTFDFRLAVRERERAIRLIEAMLNRSARSGENLDREMLDQLRALAAGWAQPPITVQPESEHRSREEGDVVDLPKSVMGG